jgi:hypothetical protein
VKGTVPVVQRVHRVAHSDATVPGVPTRSFVDSEPHAARTTRPKSDTSKVLATW